MTIFCYAAVTLALRIRQAVLRASVKLGARILLMSRQNCIHGVRATRLPCLDRAPRFLGYGAKLSLIGFFITSSFGR